jgi:hypothetical protein
MKKLFLLIIPILLLCGCTDLESTDINDKNSCYKIICDEKYNVEYVINDCTYKGGISVRLDENGNVVHCK